MQPAKSVGPLQALSVSPVEADHSSLQSIFDHSTWALLKADGLRSALTVLRTNEISVILCERDLISEHWIDLLDCVNDLPLPPSVIITSRLADDRLWAEALNLGAWDVLAKPFDPKEVWHSVKSAWQHWQNRMQTAARRTGMKAAS